MLNARRPDVVGPFTAAFSQRGIVSDWPFAGKRKVCEDFESHAHCIHNFSTSTKIVQFASLAHARAFVFRVKRNCNKKFR